MSALESLALEVGISDGCEALDISRATFYRHRGRERAIAPSRTKRRSHRALRPDEHERVLSVLHAPEFVDKSPAAVWAELLDQGIYLCSIRTMYRILSEAGEVRERRDQLRHPTYAKPELVATGPNQVWSWDITKLLGPAKWVYYYLYVILDIFSRYVVGWMLAEQESAELAKLLIRETCVKEGIETTELTIHSDRGPSMKSKAVALLLADLGVTKSHSRPHVSNDNPYSEAQFKTLKYRPEFPDRFGSPQHGRTFCRGLFHWYNHEHYHSALGFLTPAMVHRGRTEEVLRVRAEVLNQAYARHPERFVRKAPAPTAPPSEVWINRPERSFEVAVGGDERARIGPEEVAPTAEVPPSWDPRDLEIGRQTGSGEAGFGGQEASSEQVTDSRSERASAELVIR
jgi:putative transposase